MPKVVCVRSLVPNEKNSARLGDLAGHQRTRAAARSWCRPDSRPWSPVSFATAAAIASMRALTRSSSALVAISGTITSRHHRLAGALAGLDRRLEDRARLHLGDLRIGDREAAAAEAEHRIELVQLARRGPRASSDRRPSPPRPRAISSSLCGRNSCSGGSSSRIVTGRPFMISNSSMKSPRCIGSSLASAARRALLVVGQDHLAHRADAVLVEEHVLGAAEPDALGAELQRDARVVRRVGIGAHAELAHLVGPAHQRREFARQRRLDHRHAAGQHLPGRAVDGDDLALLEGLAGRRSSSAPRNRRAASPRPRRRACPCRAPPRPHARSCRRAW